MAADETGVPNNLTLVRWNDGSSWHSLVGAYQVKIRSSRYSKYDGDVQEPGGPRAYVEILVTDLTEVWEMLSHTTATGAETDAQLEFTYSRKSGVARKVTITNVIFVGNSEIYFGNTGGLGDQAKDKVNKIVGEIRFASADDTIGAHITTANA